MSIIQEALKKAEQQIKDAKTGAAASQPSPSSGGGPHIKTSMAAGPVEEKKRSGAGHDPKAVAILLVVLIVVAGVAATQFLPKKGVPMKPVPAPQSQVEAQPASSDQEKARKPAAVNSSKGEEFPTLSSIVFQPPAVAGAPSTQLEEKKPAPPEFILNGIMYLEGSPRAIVNDSMVEVGDVINGARVVKIDKRNVLLEYNNSEVSLDLK